MQRRLLIKDLQYTANEYSQSTAFVQSNGCNQFWITVIDCTQPTTPIITAQKVAYSQVTVSFCKNYSFFSTAWTLWKALGTANLNCN